MRTAASVTFFKPEFDEFLYAPIGLDSNEMTLSVLSALTRLHLDPWKEAAELAMLPKHAAASRLAALFVRLPGGPWPQAEPERIADRLIELLPRNGESNALAARKVGFPKLGASTIALIAIAVLLAVVLAVGSLERSSSDDTRGSAPSTIAVPQTSPK